MLVTGNWFTEWFNSPYYHKLYYKRDEKEASGFINRLLEVLKAAPGAMILDAACGTGHNSVFLAAKGFDVSGVDLSHESIEIAKASENDHLHFFQHDLRLPFWVNYFDYALNLFNNFGHFRTEREHHNSIRTMANSLKPGGIMVIDYLNAHYAEDHLVHKSEKQVDEVTYYITKWYDETHFYKKIVIEDEQLKEPLEFTEKIAKLPLGDFNDMLAFHKMQMQEVYGDYQFGNYHVKNSSRLLMIAKKTV